MKYLKLVAVSLLISLGIVKTKTTMTDVSEANKPETSKPGSVVYGSECFPK